MKHPDKKNEMPLRDYSWIIFLPFVALGWMAFKAALENAAALIVWLGYRFVPWPEVRDVMRVYNQAFTHGMMTLMITTTQGHVYRPDEKGYIPPAQRRAFFREWIAGKSFMIDCSGKKSGPKIVAYVEKYYGPLDYDFVAEREKQHPTPKKWW